MKIAVIGILTHPVSAVTHGGTETITYSLVEELVRRGHDVTLFASADSHTSAQLVSVCDSPTAQTVSMNGNLAQPYSMLLARQLAERSGEYDVIHNNFFHTYIMAAFAPFLKAPLIHTVHNSYFSDPNWNKALTAYKTMPRETYVFVSEHARSQANGFKRAVTVYNGIDTNLYPYNDVSDEYVLWIGRMVPEKGASDAVLAVRGTARELKLITVIKEGRHNEYLDDSVMPVIGDNVELITDHQDEQKTRLYQQAKAVFFPSHWEEPFGLVMVEAMACGTPVIAYARGAAPEIVEDGVTGFLVNHSEADARGAYATKKTGIDGLREAMEHVYALSPTEYKKMRLACRKRVESTFTVKHMVDGYETLYNSIINT